MAKELTMTTTDEHAHLLPLEPAARHYCASLGVDPDQMLADKPGLLVGVVNARPQWHLAAEKLLDMMHMMAAIRHGAGGQAVVAPTEH